MLQYYLLRLHTLPSSDSCGDLATFPLGMLKTVETPRITAGRQARHYDAQALSATIETRSGQLRFVLLVSSSLSIVHL
jgi:hypothetical protein